MAYWMWYFTLIYFRRHRLSSYINLIVYLTFYLICKNTIDLIRIDLRVYLTVCRLKFDCMIVIIWIYHDDWIIIIYCIIWLNLRSYEKRLMIKLSNIPKRIFIGNWIKYLKLADRLHLQYGQSWTEISLLLLNKFYLLLSSEIYLLLFYLLLFSDFN